MTDILDRLSGRAQERAAKFKTHKVNQLPNPYNLHEWATLGTYSYFLMQTQRRLVLRDGLLKLDKGVWETMSSVARDYLDLAYTRSPTIKHDQAEIFKAAYIPEDSRIRNAPQYFKQKEIFEHGFYIDIISTYWSILSIIGWNLDYYPGQWLAPGRIPEDWPFPQHKTARACLVSVARPGQLLQYNPEGRTQAEKFPLKKIGSKIMNLGISLLIADILHSIGKRAVEAGAVYVNADGYIAPNEKVAAAIAQVIYDWGLPARIKDEGRGEVLGIGNYKVGRTESEPHVQAWGRTREARAMTRALGPIDKIQKIEYEDWLRPRFAKFSAGKEA